MRSRSQADPRRSFGPSCDLGSTDTYVQAGPDHAPYVDPTVALFNMDKTTDLAIEYLKHRRKFGYALKIEGQLNSSGLRALPTMLLLGSRLPFEHRS